MKNKLTYMAGVVAVLMGMGSVVEAVPITGAIGFTGTYLQNGGTLGNLTTATSMNVNSTAVGTTTGSFVGASLISFATPISVNPAVGLSKLWSVLVGSTTYNFTVTSESEDLNTPTGLHLLGAGVLTDGNAADTINGVWQLGFGVSGGAFMWQSTSGGTSTPVTSVPDGGSTAALLGAGFCGLCFFTKKVKA